GARGRQGRWGLGVREDALLGSRGGEGHDLLLAARDKRLVERAQLGVMASGRLGCHEQRVFDGMSSTACSPIAFTLGAFVGVWSQSCQGSDLASLKGAELRQQSKQGRRCCLAGAAAAL